MNNKSIKKNYIYNVSYQILLLLTPLITAPYLSRVLEPDGVGTASYLESVVSYFTLFATMGMTTFGQREISYVQDIKEKRTNIFWETVIIELITASVAIVVYIIFALHHDNSNLYLVLVFHIISVVANVTWFFQGMEEFGRIVLRNIVFKIIHIAYIFLFIHSKNDLIWYLFGLSFFTLLSNISLWFSMPKFVGLPKWRELRLYRHIKVMISLFIPTIAIQVYTTLDKTMIGILTHDSYQNAYYEQAIKISRMALMIVTSLSTVVIPRVGYYFEQKKMEEVKRLMYRGYRFVWFLGIPLCLGLMATTQNFVPWFFGASYDGVIPLLMILSLLILAIGFSNVTGMQYLIPTKRQNIFTLTVCIGAGINFVMNLIFIKQFQAIGAAISSVAAETVIAIVQLAIVRKELNLWQVLREGVHYYIAGGIMLIAVLYAGTMLSPSVAHTAILILWGGGIYIIALLVMQDEYFISNIKQVLKKIKR